MLVFPCDVGHVTCLECFRHYCTSRYDNLVKGMVFFHYVTTFIDDYRLNNREFLFHPQFGYTLSCPAGCENSMIKETHHFKLLTENQVSFNT